MKRFVLIFVALCLVLLLCLALLLLDCFSGYEALRDVRYGEGEAAVMDVYFPKGMSEKESAGCILLIHGGSWAGGDKREEEARCRLLAGRGYIAASVNYTLWSEETAGEYTVFGVMSELDASLIALRDLAARRGVTVDRAALSGYSAGAHLALLYAYSRGGDAPLSLVFVSGMAGPADISGEVWGSEMAATVGTRLSGVRITPEMVASGEADALLASVSPVTYVNGDSPPTLLVHGGRDPVVPPANAESLVGVLEGHGVPVEYRLLARSDHSLMQNPLGHLGYYGRLLVYCREYLK